jgi:hypothetical protein
MVMSFSQQFVLYRNVEFQKFKHSNNFSAKLASVIKSSIRRAALCLPRWQRKMRAFPCSRKLVHWGIGGLNRPTQTQ